MKKLTRFFGAAAASFGLTIAAAQAQDDAPPQLDPPQENAAGAERPGVLTPDRPGGQADEQAREGALYKADDLIGGKIRNPQGEDLGEVEELVVNATNGNVRYAVVTYGGFLGLGDKLFAVPLQATKVERNEEGEAFFVVDVDQQRLENAQGFDKENWPNFADRSFTGGIDRTYGVEADAGGASEQGQLYKLSTFDGVNVRDAANKELGEVERILVDPQRRKVAFLALDVEDEAVTGVADDALLAVPMDKVSLKTADGDTFLSVALPADRLQGAPTIDEDAWDASKSGEWRRQAERHFDAAGSETGNRTGNPIAPGDSGNEQNAQD